MTYTIHTRADGTKYKTLDISNYERKVQAKLAAERAKARHLQLMREQRQFN